MTAAPTIADVVIPERRPPHRPSETGRKGAMDIARKVTGTLLAGVAEAVDEPADIQASLKETR